MRSPPRPARPASTSPAPRCAGSCWPKECAGGVPGPGRPAPIRSSAQKNPGRGALHPPAAEHHGHRRRRARPGDAAHLRPAGELPGAWRRCSAGAGAPGQRLYDWARIELLAGFDPSWARRVLARRSIPTEPGEEPELAYYVCAGPAATTLEQLIPVAGGIWRIEECFQAAKNEAALASYQVRDYTAWYRHITLAMLAHAFLSATRATAEKGGPQPETASSSR